jgi:hypothetical protein
MLVMLTGILRLVCLQVAHLLGSHVVTVVKDVHDVTLSHMHTEVTDTKLGASPSLIASTAWTRMSSTQAFDDDVSVPVNGIAAGWNNSLILSAATSLLYAIPLSVHEIVPHQCAPCYRLTVQALAVIFWCLYLLVCSRLKCYCCQLLGQAICVPRLLLLRVSALMLIT